MSPILEGALRSLKQHPAVSTVEVQELVEGGVRARAVFQVNLPSRWAVAGHSPNGVLAQEEVSVEFAADFPLSAPNFYLRPDFPTDLPHIYPHKKGERVPPCIAFGDRRDVLHGDGVYRLADQMSDWLDKAALDCLTDNELGWQPSRRDWGFNLLQVDTDAFLSHRPPFGGWRIYSCHGVWSDDGKVSFAASPQSENPVGNRAWLNGMLGTHKVQGDVRFGRAAMVICWPRVSEGGVPAVHGKYKADTVGTFSELAEQAAEWDCRVALDDFIANINPLFRDRRLDGNLPLYLVFPVRRPRRIIGLRTEYEMMAYRMSVVVPHELAVTETTAVTPAWFVSPVTEGLLRRTSGLTSQGVGVRYTFAGCGSLGSKIALHIARAGVQPGMLIDNRRFVAHNVARHALLPDDSSGFQSKAGRLAEIISTFRERRPKTFLGDLREIRFDSTKFRDSFNDPSSVIVNTTGSPAIRDFFTKAPFEARVLEGALLNRGTHAFFTFEGPGRNPTSADLMYHCYENIRPAGVLRDALSNEESVLEVGVGCHSVTMPMSDARVSLVAAGIGHKLLEYDGNGLPEHGIAATAEVEGDGMSIRWAMASTGPTQTAQVFDNEGWTVRVLDRAHQKIVADTKSYQSVESGGLIVGGISALTREIFVVDILPAPADSSRSSARFELGVDGCREAIEAYEALGGKTLWCLGTWHSHLHVSGPSQMDRNTAAELDGQLRHAAVLLIRHPEGYAALVRDAPPL